MKKEELDVLKMRVDELKEDLKKLSEEDLMYVVGGVGTQDNPSGIIFNESNIIFNGTHVPK